MEENFCRIKGCDNKVFTRGVCNRHYHRFNYAVKNNKTTWESLESRGLIKPKGFKMDKVDGSVMYNETPNLSMKGNLTIQSSTGTVITILHPTDEEKPTRKKILKRVQDLLNSNDLEDLKIIVMKD